MALTIFLCISVCLAFPNVVLSDETIGGLPLDTAYLKTREIIDERTTTDGTNYISSYTSPGGSYSVSVICESQQLTRHEETGSFNLSCSLSHNSTEAISLSFSSDYSVSVALSQPFVVDLPDSTSTKTQEVVFPLKIAQIGDAYLVARYESTVTVGVRLLVLREDGTLDVIFRAGVIILLILATFFMACELDFESVKIFAKRPFGPILGFLCQFIAMPLVS